MTRFSPTERLGVTAVEKIFLEFGWIPRTILQTDVGIDMIVEICNEGNPIGKFIGVQIKTGESYFKETSGRSVIFRTDKTHVEYWLANALPVIVVLHNQITDDTIWQLVKDKNVESTGKNFKIEIPLSNVLKKSSHKIIETLSGTSPLLTKFQKFLLDKHIMDKILSGEKIVVELHKWVNKSSGKADITILHVIQDNEFDRELEIETNLEEEKLEEFSVYELRSHYELSSLYPWADFKLDEEFYETFSDYDDSQGIPGYQLVFADERFSGYKLKTIPYHTTGEISKYRLVMSLNSYGHTFINFCKYANGNMQLTIDFDS